MKPSRRQFGLWSAAALLAPSAFAGSPDQVAKAHKAAKLKDLEVTTRVTSREPREITVEIRAKNPSPHGLTLEVGVSECDIDGVEATFGACWLNDDYPFARRIMAPSYVDVGPKATLAIAVLHIQIDPETVKKDGFARVAIVLTAQGSETHPVTLDPIALAAVEAPPES